MKKNDVHDFGLLGFSGFFGIWDFLISSKFHSILIFCAFIEFFFFEFSGFSGISLFCFFGFYFGYFGFGGKCTGFL
jgi:hypothetical protein